MTTPNPKAPKPIRLPFEKRRNDGDWGGWIYQKRVGLMTTILVFLLGTIAFLSYRIVINKTSDNLIAIEFEREPETPLTPDQIKAIEQIQKLEQAAFVKAQNKINNENSELNSSLRDSKNTNAKEIYDQVDRINREMAQGQADYERGLREIQQKSKPTTKTPETNSDKSAKAGDKNQRERVRGDVFVSYNLADRTDTYLHIPAYQCQYGGMVVVNITVNRSGKVISAKVDKATSSSDQCIERMAVQSAQASSFSSSSSAPEKQSGTITYRFVAQ